MRENKNMKGKELEILKERIVRVLKKYKIKKAEIFGSYVRGEQKENSNIDILIEPNRGMSLLDLSGIKIEIENKLKKNVDLSRYKYINPYIKKNILKNELRII